MKKCSICKQQKDKLDFNRKLSRKDGLQPHCRKCSNKKSKEYYRKNKKKHYEIVKKNNKRYIERNREFVYQYLLKHPCVDCDEANPILLDFDHVKEKIIEVSKLYRDAFSIKRIQEEIDRCKIRCVKCHRLKTAKTHDWWIFKRHMGL
jgi:hypothetical protein